MSRTSYVLILLTAFLLLLPVILFAQEKPFVPLSDANQSPMLSSLYSSGDLAGYVNKLFAISISLGAIIAVLRIAYAGYTYMMSDMWTSKSKAKEILGEVVLGLILLLGVYLILYQINPCILDLNILNRVKTVSGEVQYTGCQAR